MKPANCTELPVTVLKLLSILLCFLGNNASHQGAEMLHRPSGHLNLRVNTDPRRLNTQIYCGQPQAYRTTNRTEIMSTCTISVTSLEMNGYATHLPRSSHSHPENVQPKDECPLHKCAADS